MSRRWGRAGVRLTSEEIRHLDRQRVQRAADRALAEQQAYRDWAAGRMVPACITQALDLRALYGPEVDEACGAREPDVDRWEAGTLYPTWEQVRALAKLVALPVGFFFRRDYLPLLPEVTTLRFHRPDWFCRSCGSGTSHESPVLSFTREAIDARKAARS